MNAELSKFITARYGEKVVLGCVSKFNSIIIDKKFYWQRGDFIYEGVSGCTYVHYLNGVIAHTILTGRHYSYDETGRLIRVRVDKLQKLLGVYMEVYKFEFNVGPHNDVKVNMWHRRDGSGTPQGTRVLSFDNYVSVFGEFFWPHARDKIWLRILLDRLHQPVAEEIADHMI